MLELVVAPELVFVERLPDELAARLRYCPASNFSDDPTFRVSSAKKGWERACFAVMRFYGSKSRSWAIRSIA